jgi:hypothetical protein
VDSPQSKADACTLRLGEYMEVQLVTMFPRDDAMFKKGSCATRRSPAHSVSLRDCLSSGGRRAGILSRKEKRAASVPEERATRSTFRPIWQLPEVTESALARAEMALRCFSCFTRRRCTSQQPAAPGGSTERTRRHEYARRPPVSGSTASSASPREPVACAVTYCPEARLPTAEQPQPTLAARLRQRLRGEPSASRSPGRPAAGCQTFRKHPDRQGAGFPRRAQARMRAMPRAAPCLQRGTALPRVCGGPSNLLCASQASCPAFGTCLCQPGQRATWQPRASRLASLSFRSVSGVRWQEPWFLRVLCASRSRDRARPATSTRAGSAQELPRAVPQAPLGRTAAPGALYSFAVRHRHPFPSSSCQPAGQACKASRPGHPARTRRYASATMSSACLEQRGAPACC